MFFFVSTLLAYITIPKNKGNIKITWDKKLTTTYCAKLTYKYDQMHITKNNEESKLNVLKIFLFLICNRRLFHTFGAAVENALSPS